ncbi:MAG: SPASM domain-containing protein [Acidobacteria bacterium]|nr:SPASM domain-containing protein [Acidobacteriota bacterium]
MNSGDTEKTRFTCDWIFDLLVVLSDGKVVCGCADPYGERPLGHLKDEPILDIWRSARVREIREGLNAGYAPFCEPCGLKRRLSDESPVPQRPVDLERLPRIFLEPTVLCNLSCFQAVCNHDSGILKTRERSRFPLDEFKRLIDEVGEHLIRLDLFNYGDPFVHPQAVEMVEYVKSRYPQVFLYVSTNGLMLDEDKIQRLVISGMDEITFSVDGPDQKTYERYRCGGDFSGVLSLMASFIAERDKTGREVPYINWRYILFRWNDSRRRMNKTRRLAEKIGADRLTWEITDHPAAARSKRYQIGTKAWNKIYHEIWDSSQIGNAIPGRRLRADIQSEESDPVMTRGQPLRCSIRVKNTGGALWRKQAYSGRRIIRLGAQLHNAEGRLLDLNYARAFLNRDMTGGDTDTLSIELPDLPDPGEYRLKFDMVSEGIDWFESGGSPVLWTNLMVKESG